MIVASINNGLGNQMFQFAAARAMALDRGLSVKLDLSAFEHINVHEGFQLASAFRAKFDMASVSDLRAVLGWQQPLLVRRVLARPSLSGLRTKNWVMEPHFQYWNGIRDAPPDCYLQGYWQSEKYFQTHRQTIRSDFSFRLPLTGRNEALARKIMGLNAISLHVRRGDYANNPVAMATHGTCSPAYYRAAVDHMRLRVENPAFFVFSDDMPWARKNLKIEFPTNYIEHNSKAYDDLHLMSLCKYHIIANSTFSWWGAWLGANSDKIVVAPHQWFARPQQTDDLLPTSWVQL